MKKSSKKAGRNVPPQSWLKLSGFFVLVLLVVALVVSKTLPSEPARAIGPSPFSTNSPHWPHINILDFGRQARAIPNATIRNQAFEWLARHVDVIETEMDNSTSSGANTLSTYMHSLNPTLKTFGYDYDLTMCQKANCNQASPNPHPLFTNLPEDFYLHVMEDTQLEFRDLEGVPIETITITGCPAPQALTSACRLQVFVWTQKRWVANLANATWRQSTADRFVQQLQTNGAGQPNSIDGMFLDEHGSRFTTQTGIGYQVIVLSGGGIREYNGLRPTAYDPVTPGPLDAQYSSDINTWLSYLQGRLSAAGKFAHINTAEYFPDPQSLSNSLAMKGAMTEHINRPDSNGIIRATRYEVLIDAVKQMTAAGGTVDLSGSWCNFGPAGYTAGNYTSSKDRYKMWSLASYYLMKEAVGDPGKVYFNPNLCIDQNAVNPLDFFDEWLPAYEHNVGQPTGAMAVAAQGSLACDGLGYKIFSRDYENARVLVRVKDGFACNDYSDASAISVPLTEPMLILRADGTYSTPVSSVSIRNAEAVILFYPPDTTVPGAITDLSPL